MLKYMRIKHWEELSSAERRVVLDGKCPVVIPSLASHWPLVQHAKRNFSSLSQYLSRYDAGLSFEAMIALPDEKGRLFYTNDMRRFNFSRMRGYLKDALEVLEAQIGKHDAPAFYIGSTNVARWFPGMELECNLPVIDPSIVPNIWIGNAVNVATHNDNAENVACVAAGRRRFTLFPPDQEKHLYLAEQKETPGGRPISLVDIRQPDLEKFPLFKEALACAQVAELGPGDAIYIPKYWWHNVESLEDVNILVNFWWESGPPRLV